MTDSSAAPSPPRGKRRGGIVVPRRLKWYHHVFAWLIATGVRVVSATWRCRFIDPHGVFTHAHGPMIFAVWHNRLALSTTAWRRWGLKKNPAGGLVALISASHDGGVLSRALRYFGVEAVRGSSSRRGPQALLELTSWTQRGYHVAITPDGPRGPRYVVQDGVISLAQVTGLPIVAVTARVKGKISLRSWDRFQIPLPFAACEIYFGEPVQVPRDASDEQRAQFRSELQTRLLALNDD